MFAKNNLKSASLFGIIALLSSTLVAQISLTEVHSEAIKIFNPSENPKLSTEEKAAFENVENPAWLKLILEKTSELYANEIENDFIRVATILKAKFVELGQPFQDPRYIVLGTLADSCRRMTGYQTTYETAFDEYTMRQKELADFDFTKEKSALWKKIEPIVFFAKKICEGKFERDFVVQFCKNLIKMMVNIHEKLNSIDKSGMSTEKKGNFLELLLLLQKPIVAFPSVINVLIKKHYKINIFECFPEQAEEETSFELITAGTSADLQKTATEQTSESAK